MGTLVNQGSMVVKLVVVYGWCVPPGAVMGNLGCGTGGWMFDDGG